MVRIILCFILLIACKFAFGQITGIIVDASSGKVIEGAEIFINQSSWRSISDEEGVFHLDGIHAGFFEMVVYKKGHEIFQSNIRIQEGKEYRLNLKLTPGRNTNSRKVTRDGVWTGNFLRFKRALLGLNDVSDQFQFINPQSLHFELSGNVLIARSNEPIQIEDRVSGLIMNVHLLHFSTNLANTEAQVLVSFQLMHSDDYTQQSLFEINRLKLYWGSFRHFLQTLVTNTSEMDGFLIRNSTNGFVQPSELVSKGQIEGYYNINFSDALEVTYLKVPDAISTLKTDKLLEVNDYGLPLSTKSMVIAGSMQPSGLANRLPINYFPSFTIPGKEVFWKDYDLLQEKVYVHTDRDYYYPRESIWFKAYMTYHDVEQKDSLSKALYVDLISPQQKVIESKTLSINDGVAWGDFKLNDSLPAGQYYLRAYTNWMRNFGDSTMFVKVVPILSMNQNIAWDDKESTDESHLVKIQTDHNSYQARQAVELRLQAMDGKGNPLNAHLSVSVTDEVESVSLAGDMINTSHSLQFTPLGEKASYFDQIRYRMEPGITMQGVIKDAKGNPIPASLEIVEGAYELISVDTNDKGAFTVSGFVGMDSIRVAVMAYNRKGIQVDSIDLRSREIPPIRISVPTISLTYRESDALQRIQNTHLSEDAILLKEVVIQSSALAKPEPNLLTLNYGRPDQVVKGEMVRSVGSNILLGLKGRVPGLQVIEAQGEIAIRIRGMKSLSSTYEPLILLDGTPLPDAASASFINPYIVDRIEIIKRAVPIYGSRGVGGLIAIYTKKGIEMDDEHKKNLYTIPGYDRASLFLSPDYQVNENTSSPDFRTTIFWMPDVVTDEHGTASVRFYSADLATRYRIVVEGVTDKGTPLRAVSYITIE